MTNLIYDITQETTFASGAYIIKDIFTKSIVLNESSVTTNADWFYYITLDNDDRLENIAYRIYGNKNVWDLLFVINDMNNICDLPKHNDYVYAEAENKLNIWLQTFPNTSEDRKTELLNTYIEEITAKNEKHRQFRILKPQYLPRFRELINA